jgi:O-antigen/teichoic acid export membrane protein
MSRLALRRRWAALRGVLESERHMLLNSGSMFGTSLVTALLGAAFWLVAARGFSKAAVGVGSAAVSAMTLLGFLATVGLGTLLMGELPRLPRDRRGLINAALLVSGLVGTAFGLGFALIAPLASSNLDALSSSPAAVLIFAAGTGLTSATFVLDQSLIGLLRGGLQLVRNIAFSSSKLVALLLVPLAVTRGDSVALYATWAAGIAVSMLVLWRFFARAEGDSRRPALGVLRGMRRSAATHHLFNLALRIPDLVMPVIVVTVLSPTANASFYIAWMIASLIFAVPISLSTVLFAVGSGESEQLDKRFRITVYTSLAFGLLANLVLLAAGETILSAFGASYAANATTTLHILALGVFPEVVRTHYVTTHRISRRIPAAIPIVWGGTILELIGGTVGALVDGLTGVALGWVAAVCVEALVMGPDVLRALSPARDDPAAPPDVSPRAGASSGVS